MTGRVQLVYSFDHRGHVMVTLHSTLRSGIPITMHETAEHTSFNHTVEALKAKVLKRFKELPEPEEIDVT